MVSNCEAALPLQYDVKKLEKIHAFVRESNNTVACGFLGDSHVLFLTQRIQSIFVGGAYERKSQEVC